MRALMYAGAGLAAGFVMARLLEARAAGVPAGLALQMWYVPILRLRDDLVAVANAQQAKGQRSDPDAPMFPESLYSF